MVCAEGFSAAELQTSLGGIARASSTPSADSEVTVNSETGQKLDDDAPDTTELNVFMEMSKDGTRAAGASQRSS